MIRILSTTLNNLGFVSAGVPWSDVNLQTLKGTPPAWTASSSLSEVTSLTLEYFTLGCAMGPPFFLFSVSLVKPLPLALHVSRSIPYLFSPFYPSCFCP